MRAKRQDPTGKWRAACRDLANRLGLKRRAVLEQWKQGALCLEYELGVPRDAAESDAFYQLVEMLERSDMGLN